MGLAREDIRRVVFESLHEILGKTSTLHIDGKSKPVRGLGLDSPDGLDFACAISQKLGYEVPYDLNPFVDDDKHRGRCVDEIVDLLCRLISK